MPINADDIIKRFESLASLRSEWESLWQLCSDYVLPRSGEFRQRARHIFDDTALLALGRFAAAMESVLTPRTRKWHTLVTGDPGLDQDPEVSRWLEALRDTLFRARYAPEANFANQITEAYYSLGVHGTACLFVDDELGRGLRYKHIPLHQLYLAEDAAGRIDTVFRSYKLTARQAFQEFGEALPVNIRSDAENPTRRETEHEFLHGVFPRRELDPQRMDARNMPYASVHLARAAREVLRESGYRSLPYVVSRFVLAPGEVYGRSPAMSVLGSIIQVNVIQKTIIRAAEKMVNPPVLVSDDDVLSGFSLKPAAIIPGGLDPQGNQLVRPLLLEGKLPV
ncbi:MAG: head-tail connector protein, partial [Candidatus Adiutrix sp.]|nr:head-tail connector protein [Candidatus Adiutrix sp.]